MDEAGRSAPPAAATMRSTAAKRIPAYMSEQSETPAVSLLRQETRTEEKGRNESRDRTPMRGSAGEDAEGETAEDRTPIAPVAQVSETGETEQVEAYGRSLRLQGRTSARFSNSFRTVDVVTEPGEGCKGCRGTQCAHVTGAVESTFSVATRVTLPSAASFRGLTPCQRARVRDAITNVLAPHEQEHVDAFNTYNGTISTPFDMTICRNTFDSRVRAIHVAEERARRTAAQALSDALDPFFFDVDLDCEETAASEPEHTAPGLQELHEIAEMA
jgi:hypothetical protein